MAEPTEPVGIEWANTEIGEDWKELMAMANADAFGREHEVWPFHYESLSGRSHKPRHDSEDSSDDKHRHGHGHGHGHAPAERPPSHHGHGPPGRGPHPPAPPGRGPPPHGHGPPPPGRGPHEDAPRTTFSVLADWIFGDSSSSDSSSDSWMKASSSEDSPELAEGGRLAFPEPRDFRSSKGLLSETDRNALLAEKKASLHEKRMYRSRAEAHDEEMDWRAGGVHPNGAFHEHHQQRGDHLRFRNRLPEEYQDSLWFDEMEFNEGGDWVETLLAFFFCVGVVTLVFLPFLMLGRELRKLVLRARRSHGGNAAASFTASGSSPPAPSSSAFGGFADRRRENAVNAAAAADGYQALADDTDDDAIVVTGTPVNPPPSVNA